MANSALHQSTPPISFPVRTPAAWLGVDLRAERGWTYRLSPQEIAELDKLVANAHDGDHKPNRAEISLPSLGRSLMRWRDEIQNGRGFVLVKGVPTHRYTQAQSALAYWAIGS